MKNFICGMLIALMLLSALLVGVVAVAESDGTEAPALPPVEDVQPEQPDAEQQPNADAATDSTALQEAFDAYRAARQSGRQAEIEDELNGYVESGKLTQEQADLILKYYKEQQALRDGTCPNCGYQFQNGNGEGMGGRMNGGHGKNGGMGGRMSGGRGMFGQQPTFGQQPSGQQADGGQADGAAFGFGPGEIPAVNGTEGI